MFDLCEIASPDYSTADLGYSNTHGGCGADLLRKASFMSAQGGIDQRVKYLGAQRIISVRSGAVESTEHTWWKSPVTTDLIVFQ